MRGENGGNEGFLSDSENICVIMLRKGRGWRGDGKGRREWARERREWALPLVIHV